MAIPIDPKGSGAGSPDTTHNPKLIAAEMLRGLRGEDISLGAWESGRKLTLQIALSFAGDAFVADDLAQDALHKLLREAEIRLVEPLAVLRATVHGLWIDRMRRESYRRAVDDYDLSMITGEDGDVVVESASSREFRSKFWRIFRSLLDQQSPRSRGILLARLAGVSAANLAAALDPARANALKNRQAKAVEADLPGEITAAEKKLRTFHNDSNVRLSRFRRAFREKLVSELGSLSA